MKKPLLLLSILLTTMFSAQADDNYGHFPALDSTDINTALCNIQSYNEKLAAITSKPELTTLDMLTVHELTYTLENAVNYLKESLTQISIDLEDVHKASERLDATVIKSSGEKYLAPTTELVTQNKCSSR